MHNKMIFITARQPLTTLAVLELLWQPRRPDSDADGWGPDYQALGEGYVHRRCLFASS